MPPDDEVTPAAAGRARALLAAAALSGTAGLVHEVMWARQLTLVLGGTVTAVSTVLAAFMGGLGLGSALAGPFIERVGPRRAARAYAAIEWAVAALAPLVGPLAWALAPAAPLARLATCALLVGCVATLMGATLPVLAALRAPAAAHLGRAAGALYAVNTAGAVVGSLASVLLLLPALGVTGSLLAAAVLNLAAGALVLRAGAREAREGPAARPKGRPAPAAASAGPAHDRALVAAVLAVLALSGAAALGSEVGWTRVLVLLIGPTPYAFAFVLTAVIAGIALGSGIAARMAGRLHRPLLALCATQAAALAASLMVARAAGALPLTVAALVRDSVDDMGRLLALELLGVVALLLLPCACFGAAFPIALHALRRTGSVARVVGGAYAANTAGAIAGALLAGLVALPALGARGTLIAAACASGAACVLGALAARGSPAFARAILAAVAAVLALAAPRVAGRWDRELLAGGVYKYAAYAPPERLENELRAGELVFDREGRGGTVTVKRLGGRLSLAIDGKVDATTSTDMLTQRMLAHLPLLLHGRARSVCIVGLGSGVTAASALTHPLEAVEVVEISPEVIAASRLFREVNRDFNSDRRLRVVQADGRNHLLLSPRRYDVLVSEPSNPWMAGVASLFTREFFALARARLAPGGLMCQWAHVYNMRLDDLRTLVGGFTDVFPGAALFLVNEGDLLLIGSEAELPAPSAAELVRRMEREAVRADLAEVGVASVHGLASLFAAGPPAVAEWARGAPRHTDERPRLELSAPRAMHADTGRENRSALLEAGRRAPAPEPFAALLADPPAPALLERARMLEGAGSPDWAREVYASASARDPSSAPALEGVVRTALALGRPAEAEADLRARLASGAEAAPRIALALLLRHLGRLPEALALLQEAARLAPGHPRPLVLGAETQRAGGNLDAAEGLARAALSLAPSDEDAVALLAAIAFERGALQDAQRLAASVLERSPRHARALEVTALARVRLGDRAGAREAFEALLRAEPDGWAHLNNYALFELEGGDAAAAARWFEHAVDMNPGNAPGWAGLAEAAQALGDAARASRARDALARLGPP